MTILYVVLLLSVFVFGTDLEGENSRQTRLLLHTDLDLAQQITLLTSRLDAQQASLTRLIDKNVALSKTVEEQQTNLTNLTDLNNALSKKVDEQQRVIVNFSNVCNENAELSKKVNSQQATLVNLADKNMELSFKLDAQHGQIVNLTNQLSMRDQDVQALKSTIDHQTGTGSTYTRWGRTTCPGNGTDLVYEGYMGGSSRDNSGGGTNYLCLSSNPQWDHYDETIDSVSTIVGVEYEFGAFINQDGASQFFGKNIYNDDAPCAVCHTKRSTTLMIPGRTDCYSGWTKEYSGYIATESEKQNHQTEFICVDRRPDVVVGGKTNDNEGLLYFVEASCGRSLECPPYIDGRELACVICSL